MKKLLIILAFLPLGLNAQVHNLNGGGLPSTLDLDSLTVTYLDYSPPHGHFAFSDSSFSPSMTQNAWVSVTNTGNDLFSLTDASNVTFAGDSLTINADKGGDYLMMISLSFNGNNTDIYEIALFKNNALESVKIERSTTNNATGNISLPWYAEEAEAGDDFTLKIRNTNNNNDAAFVACSWVVWLLHPE